MSDDPTYLLEDLLFDLTEIQSSDILADADLSKREIHKIDGELQPTYVFPLDATWSALLKIAVHNKRQSDTETLCLAVNGIRWEYKGKKVVSPLWLIPASYRINKVKQEIHWTIDLENSLFNPFVKNELKRRYDLVWDEPQVDDISQKSNEFHDFLAKSGLNYEEVCFLAFGNFHHHRFQIVKDLEALTKTELNPLVDEMLGNPVPQIDHPLELTKQNIVAADKDQKRVFQKITAGNLVIQGPPGTGKSQVLTNLLAKLLQKGNMNLVVSEKKAALEVLVKKLSVHGLDAFAFVSHNQTKPSDFITKLKETWKVLETEMQQPEKNLLLSEQLLSQLQLTLDRLVSKELIGGTGWSTFQKMVAQHDLPDVPYSSKVPSVAEWLSEKEKVEALFAEISSFRILKHFRQKGLTGAVKLDQTLDELKTDFELLGEKLAFQTFAELEVRITQISRCQILENESYKQYARLFSSQRDRKKLEKLRTSFMQQKKALELLQAETQVWKTQPSLSLAQSWNAQLSENWWQKRKAERQVKAALASAQVVPHIALENWLQYLSRASALQLTVSALQELGIERPEIELESIHYLLRQLEKEDSNELNQVAGLPVSLRKNLADHGAQLQQSFRNLKNILDYDLADLVLETIDRATSHLPEILQCQQKLQAISPQVYPLMQQFASPEAIEKLVLKSNWVQFESHFPELAKFNGSMLQASVEKIIRSEKEENLTFGRNLLYQHHQKFAKLHEILRIPASKLKAEEKGLKANLKAGKAILVKEFAKSRQHKTIRELLDSEARAWIEVLTPIWLSTTTQVASSFPMERGLFECVIFDEASQIPLSHALGSLQRGERAIVAGDEQQMSPGSYFSGNSSGVDLLHQASYYWDKSPLKHHYRSMHPELIAFSNRFFYNNELIAYPSADRSEKPLKIHFVPDGVYDGRQNVPEAQAVGQQIEALLGQADSLGIVAFSEQQLDCIWKQLPAAIQQELSQRMDSGTAFFKALEQVQGDECDALVISLGYGRNPDGEFHLRFGPLNRKNGSKRLNVLLSRAKKSIDFYTSIQACDLPVSTNEAVNLLRFFLQGEQSQAEVTFPFGLKPHVTGNQLEFEDLVQALPDAEEQVVLHSVLKDRGWNLMF